MTAEDFAHWRSSLAWSTARTALELGCTRKTVHAYETGASRIPRYIALAVAAIQFHLPPYGSGEC